jgi:uroporphyrinogen decarboxylase
MLKDGFSTRSTGQQNPQTLFISYLIVPYMVPSSKPLLDVLNGQMPKRRPVWLMRQAGRYLPEYREVRAKAGSFLELCYTPKYGAEVTLQPLRRFDFDAAILFSDILVVPHAMGLDLKFVENEGPKLQTVRGEEQVTQLSDAFDAWQFNRVYETVSQVRSSLDPHIGFIGFCGAPWTVASYMIEGGSSDRKTALKIAIDNPAWFAAMMDKLVAVSVRYLLGQIKAGVEAVQIFDSWAGDVPSAHRNRVVYEPISRIASGVRAVHPGFPVIAFGRGLGGDHAALAKAVDANVVGVEEDEVLSKVLAGLPRDCGVQGNLPPEAMSEDGFDLARGVAKVIEGVPMSRHIFNLGHGIRPDAKVERVTRLLAEIRKADGT